PPPPTARTPAPAAPPAPRWSARSWSCAIAGSLHPRPGLDQERPGQDNQEGDQLGEGGEGEAEGDDGQGEGGGGAAEVAGADGQGAAEEDVAGQEQGGAAGQQQGVGQVEGVVGVADGVLEAGGQGDDAEQHDQVPVAERLDGDPAAPGVGDGGQGPLGAGVVAAEVRPPQAGGEQQPEHGHGGQGQVDGEVGGADADGHDRLAQGDDHHQAVALDEMGRGDPEAAHGGEQGGEPLQRERRPPQQVGGGAVGQHGRQDQQGRDQVEGGQADQRADGGGLRGARVEAGVDAHDHQVGDPEGDVPGREGPRDGQGQDQEAGHAAEQQQPAGRPNGGAR